MDHLGPIVAQLGRALIALDFDGTLAPIVGRPQDAVVRPEALEALRDLAPHVGCLAVISGRPVGFLVRELGLDSAPFPIVVLGGYGRERWRDGVAEDPGPPAEVRAALDELQALVAAAPNGVRLEDKGAGLAVHTRQAEDPEAAVRDLQEPVRAVATHHGLRLEPGRYVLELRPLGVDKGAALLDLVNEHQPDVLLYAGDDLGDLAAFDVVEELRGDGIAGVTVCAGSEEVPTLAERADIVVDGPAGVAGLLRSLVPGAAG